MRTWFEKVITAEVEHDHKEYLSSPSAEDLQETTTDNSKSITCV